MRKIELTGTESILLGDAFAAYNCIKMRHHTGQLVDRERYTVIWDLGNDDEPGKMTIELNYKDVDEDYNIILHDGTIIRKDKPRNPKAGL